MSITKKKSQTAPEIARSSPPKNDLKIVSSAKADESVSEKKSPKVHYCKELNCSQTSQLKGMCRLHYLKFLALQNKPASAKSDDGDEELERAEKWNRRRSNRMGAFESTHENENSQAREARIEHLGALDADLTTFLDSEDLDPFKKTG